MTPIKITAPLVQLGHVQLPQNLHISVPDDVAKSLEAEGSAERLPDGEFAVLRHAHAEAAIAPTARKKAKR